MIKGLPGFVWVYPGKKDPLTGQVAKTRYALNLLDGEKLSLRQAQKRVAGGVSYEKRRPKEVRKKYTRRMFGGKYTRYGPFHTLPDLIEQLEKLPGTSTGYVQVFGIPVEGSSPNPYAEDDEQPRKKVYRTVSTITDTRTVVNELKRVERGEEGSNKFARRLDENLKSMIQIDRWYFYKKN